jgi:hypothetical protein
MAGITQYRNLETLTVNGAATVGGLLTVGPFSVDHGTGNMVAANITCAIINAVTNSITGGAITGTSVNASTSLNASSGALATIVGAATANGTLAVSGAVTMASTLAVTGQLNVGSNAYIDTSGNIVSSGLHIGFVTVGGFISNLRSNGTDSYLTDNSTHVDTIVTNTYTLSNNPTTGITATIVYGYRITFDRVCDLRIKVTFSAAPTTVATLAITGLPAAITPDLLNGEVPTAVGRSNVPSAPFPTTFVNGTTWTINGIANFVAGETTFHAQFMYSLPKPTF